MNKITLYTPDVGEVLNLLGETGETVIQVRCVEPHSANPCDECHLKDSAYCLKSAYTNCTKYSCDNGIFVEVCRTKVLTLTQKGEFYWDLRGNKCRFAYPSRQVKYVLTQSEPRRVQVVTKEGTKEGTFIQYGVDHVEYESGPGHFSTVIAEMDDGTVCNAHVSCIKFIKGD